jgi:hypothetical protein
MQWLTKDDVEITISAEMDDMPVNGNAIASGDYAYDELVEREILDRLNAGDAWAWAFVTVSAKWDAFEASDSLGGCSYESERDFIENSGYYDDMVSACLADLNDQIIKTHSKIQARM